MDKKLLSDKERDLILQVTCDTVVHMWKQDMLRFHKNYHSDEKEVSRDFCLPCQIRKNPTLSKKPSYIEERMFEAGLDIANKTVELNVEALIEEKEALLADNVRKRSLK